MNKILFLTLLFLTLLLGILSANLITIQSNNQPNLKDQADSTQVKSKDESLSELIKSKGKSVGVQLQQKFKDFKDTFSQAWDIILQVLIKTLYGFGIGLVTPIALAITLVLLGFGVGIAAGSIAAICMRHLGPIAQGSRFACTQSLGATRFFFQPYTILCCSIIGALIGLIYGIVSAF